jgi:hypothetical protein
MPDPKINKSVGDGGVNNAADVKVIQKLLNQLGDSAPIEENGVCGEDTIAAIRKFQGGFLSKPDGRIDPGGNTFNHLLKVISLGFQLLPQVAPEDNGVGYYSYSVTDRQFGTPATIKMLQDVALAFHQARPELRVGIGDISFRDGSVMKPHKSHRGGRNIDIRPLRKDGMKRGVSFTESGSYDREATRLLAQTLFAHPNVRKILFNDPKIEGVKPFKDHDNHFHVETKE